MILIMIKLILVKIYGLVIRKILVEIIVIIGKIVIYKAYQDYHILCHMHFIHKICTSITFLIQCTK